MITIQPETKGRLIVGKASHQLTVEDYETILIPKLRELMEEHKKVRVLIEIDPSFEGWTWGALKEGGSFGLTHRDQVERVALVGAPEWLKNMTTVVAHFLPAELKHYDTTELKEAMEWVSE